MATGWSKQLEKNNWGWDTSSLSLMSAVMLDLVHNTQCLGKFSLWSQGTYLQKQQICKCIPITGSPQSESIVKGMNTTLTQRFSFDAFFMLLVISNPMIFDIWRNFHKRLILMELNFWICINGIYCSLLLYKLLQLWAFKVWTVYTLLALGF